MNEAFSDDAYELPTALPVMRNPDTLRRGRILPGERMFLTPQESLAYRVLAAEGWVRKRKRRRKKSEKAPSSL